MRTALRPVVRGLGLALVLQGFLLVASTSVQAFTLLPLHTPKISLTLPSLPRLPVSLPHVSLPQLPTGSVSPPQVSVPQVSPGGVASVAGSALGATSTGYSAAGQPLSLGSGQAGAPGAAADQTAGARQQAALHAAHIREQRRARAQQQRLHALVWRMRACLGAIAPGQAQALRLATGIGASRSYLPRQLARVLGVSLSREGRIERSALAALTGAEENGGCGGEGVIKAATVVVDTTAQFVSLAPTTQPAAGQRPARTAQTPPVRSRPATETVRPPRATASTRSAFSGPLPPGIRSGSSIAEWLFLLAAAAIASWLAVSDLRSRMRGRSRRV